MLLVSQVLWISLTGPVTTEWKRASCFWEQEEERRLERAQATSATVLSITARTITVIHLFAITIPLRLICICLISILLLDKITVQLLYFSGVKTDWPKVKSHILLIARNWKVTSEQLLFCNHQKYAVTTPSLVSSNLRCTMPDRYKKWTHSFFSIIRQFFTPLLSC